MRVVWSLVAALSLAALMVVSNGCTTKKALAESSDAEARGADAVATVPVLSLHRASLTRTTTQPATVHPNYQAKIYAKVSGYLKELHADIGKKVQKDEVLGVIWVPEMEKEIESQQKTLERLSAEEQRAEAGVELARANLLASRASVGQARSEVAKADAQLAADRAEHKRIEELVANKSVAGRLLDEVDKRCASAEAAKAAAQASIAVAEAQVNVSAAKLKTSEADLRIVQADTAVACKKLEEMETMSAYAELKAPFAGVVTQRHIDLGDLVRTTETASRLPLFTVAQVDVVRVRVMVPEKDAAWVKEGRAGTLRLQALPRHVFEGHVSRLSGCLDESTRTMIAEVNLPNAQAEILPGMYGEMTLVLEEQPDALVVPAKTVRHDELGHAFVYAVTSEGVVRKTAVTTGLDSGAEIQILSPLDGSERIVDGTINTLKDGARIRVQN